MKKLLMILAICMAGTVWATDYTLETTVEVPVTTVNTNVTTTTAEVEHIMIMLKGPAPRFILRLAAKDVDGNILQRRSVSLTQEQLAVFMPSIDAIMAGGRATITANIATLWNMGE